MCKEVVEDDADGFALALASAKEGDALCMRAQPGVYIAEGPL